MTRARGAERQGPIAARIGGNDGLQSSRAHIALGIIWPIIKYHLIPYRESAMSLVTPEAVAAVMDLQPVPHTLAELEALVREGLPKSALRAGVEACARFDLRSEPWPEPVEGSARTEACA